MVHGNDSDGPSAVVATVTTPGEKEAEELATMLVERRIAACAQLVGPIRSVYRWNGAVESEREWLLLIKTTREHLDVIERLLDEVHPYEVPELVATPVVGGGREYLAWIVDSVGGDAPT